MLAAAVRGLPSWQAFLPSLHEQHSGRLVKQAHVVSKVRSQPGRAANNISATRNGLPAGAAGMMAMRPASIATSSTISSGTLWQDHWSSWESD